MADAAAWRWLRWPVAVVTAVAPGGLAAGLALGTLVVLALADHAGAVDPGRTRPAMIAFVTCLGLAGLGGVPAAAAVLFERRRRLLLVIAAVQGGVGLALALVAVVTYLVAVSP
jgi:hypothetical protein